MANGMTEVSRHISHPHLVLLVLPGVGEAGDDSGDPRGRGDLAGVYHDQQLHQIVVDLATATLHDVDILPTHALPDLHAARGDKQQTRISGVNNGWCVRAVCSARWFKLMDAGSSHCTIGSLLRISKAVVR